MSLGSTSNFFLGAASATGGGTAYEIQRSLRFNSADSAYLNRTPSSAGDRRKWTWSGWVKRSSLGARQQIFGAVTSGSIFGSLEFNSIDSLTFYENTLGSISIVFTTDRIFKDTSAWYHIVLALDTTQTTESDRVKLYVNGAQETSFSAGPNVAADGEGLTNSITGHNIGSWTPASSGLDLGAYLAETHFIDGQALAASDFGEYDTNNLWQPKAYTGTYNPQVNNSQDWSSAPFNSGNTSDPSYPATNAFNGSIGTTYTDGWLPANGNTITWTSDGNFSSATSVQIYYIATGGGALTVNGSAVTTTNDSTVRSVIVDVTGTGFSGFTNNWINSPNGPMSVLAVEVDGVRLVDTTVSSATSNSFNLDFSDNSSVAALGTDSSGNSNTWTVNNISVSPGAGNDSLIDSPTNYTADSGNNGGNYATLNPLITKSTTTISNGNLDVTSSGQTNAVSSIVPSSGKWYFEITLGTIVTNSFIGLFGTTPLNSSYLLYGINGYGFLNTGWGSATNTVTGTGVAGDVIGLAFDVDGKTLEFYKNGSSIGTISGWTYVENWSIGVSANTTISTPWVFNFGQRSFSYTPPTNYLSLCTTNFADPTIADGSTAMDATLWTGNATARDITGFNMSPDLAWIKKRNSATFGNHHLFDTVRGATLALISNDTQGEQTETTQLTAFNSDGFSLGTSPSSNANGDTYVAWAWDGGDLATSSNTTDYNQSQVWSDNTTGAFASSSEKLCFNGELSTSSTTGRGRPNNGTTAGFTFSNLGTVTSLKIWVHRGGTGGTVFTVNGTDVTSTVDAASNDSFVDFGSTFNSLTAITFNAVDGTNWYSIAGVEVNGKLLVDTGVIPAGSLNSSLYNQDENWSTTSGVTTPANAFDGDLSTGGVVASSGSAVTITTSSFTATRIRFYKNGNNDASLTTITVNGANYNFPQQSTATGWVEVDLGSSTTVTTFTSTWYGSYTLYAVEVDGKILVDTSVTLADVPEITSTVRVNRSAGFSIVSYTGTGVNASFAHDLNAAPQWILVKRRDSTAQNWAAYHQSIVGMSAGYLHFNLANAFNTGYTAVWNSTDPTSSVVSIGTDPEVNASGGTYIAYCWTPVEGYSAFGSYAGNGISDGPFVYTGFRPRWLFVKSSTSAHGWLMVDAARNTYNYVDNYVYANSNGAENNNVADLFTFMANGIKVGNSSATNASGATFIYAAFAEHPFKTARAR